MASSILIAKLMGPLLLVGGLVGLLNPKGLEAMGREIMASRAQLFLAGTLALLAGLAIVNTHNLWVAEWTLIITLFGWLAVVGGVVRMGFPGVTQSIGEALLSNSGLLRVIGALQVALGAFLMARGYL